MEATSPRREGGGAPAASPKKGVHIMVKLPSGTEVHEFILPVGYTVDQVKRAIFKQIPDLAKETNPNDYQLKLRDTLHSKEEILNVEFSKLQNLDTVKSAADTPLELSIFSTKMGSARGRGAEGGDNISSLPRQRGAHLPPSHDADLSTHSLEMSTPLDAAHASTSFRMPPPSAAHNRFTSAGRASVSPRSVSARPPMSPRTTSSPSVVAAMLGHTSPRGVPQSQPEAGKEEAEEQKKEGPAQAAVNTTQAHRAPSPRQQVVTGDEREQEGDMMTSSVQDMDTRGEHALNALQVQLKRAQADVARLSAKLTRIGRLARLELLPLAANTPLTVNPPAAAASDDPSSPARAVRESDIIASEKRLRATLALVLAEIERGGEDAAIKEAIDDQVASQSYLAAGAALDLAGAALTNSAKELRLRAASTAGDGQQPFEDRRKRSMSANKSHNIAAIAGRMNLDVPAGSSLASSSSSPSAMSSPGTGGSGQSPLPPRKTLTPEERTEMLQQEFLDTEETYFRSLQKLHDYFEVPLEQSGLLTPEQCDTLFSRVRTQMLEIHKHLLQTLKNRPAGKSFSDSLLTIAPYLKLYTEYVNNHPQAIGLLIELNTTSKKFAAFLKQLEQKSEVESQDLSSYLIRPIQRLPRYELLFRDMVKYTTEETEHLKLSRLLESVKKVNEHLNEAKRKRDNSTKMAAIQSNLILGKAKGQFSLFSSQMRNFVREDTLLVKKVKKEKTTFTKHHFFLFNDILLNTVKNREGKFKLHQVYHLSETSFQKYEGDLDTVALFRLSSPDSEVEDLAKAIHVKADQGGDIDGWLRDILSAKSGLRSAASEADEGRDGRFHVALV